MSTGRSRFDASFQGLGYVHQFRYALLTGLRKYDQPEQSICVEQLDDVSVHEGNAADSEIVELHQIKLHKNRDGNLGDSSPDIWKSLRVWSKAISEGKADPSKCKLYLITTSVATDLNAIRMLREHGRDSDAARQQIEQSGQRSENETISSCWNYVKQLSDAQRTLMFESITLLDGSLSATDTATEIEKCLWFVPQAHRTRIAETLIGWWETLLCRHLCSTDLALIPVLSIQQKIQDIVSQIRSESLPDDLLIEDVPERETQADDDRVFVKQLSLVGISFCRIRTAQEDRYRAYAQRSRWAREDLLGIDEEVRFETRLTSCWRERFDVMCEGVPEDADHETAAGHGANLYGWVSTEASAQQQLWFRRDFPADYMVKGSFHILADRLRVGWHPKYREMLNPDSGTEGDSE
jgi:hypothetical protein